MIKPGPVRISLICPGCRESFTDTFYRIPVPGEPVNYNSLCKCGERIIVIVDVSNTLYSPDRCDGEKLIDRQKRRNRNA